MFTTLPEIFSLIIIFSLTLSQGFSFNCLMPRLNLDSSSSNFKTLTFNVEFSSRISDGLFIFVQEISVT